MKKGYRGWFIFFGIFLILDGVLSIVFNLNQGFFSQFIRSIRLLIGIVLIIGGILLKSKK